jgi:hypothetical protein
MKPIRPQFSEKTGKIFPAKWGIRSARNVRTLPKICRDFLAEIEMWFNMLVINILRRGTQWEAQPGRTSIRGRGGLVFWQADAAQTRQWRYFWAIHLSADLVF